MAHMQPQVVFDTWYEIEDKHGEIHIVPKEVIEDFIHSELESLTTTAQGFSVTVHKDTWGGRMSAPGYLDCTDWCLYASEKEAYADLKETYGDDDDETTKE